MVEDIGDLAGLARTNPAMAFFLAMLLFSLAGIPPLAGFFAKFYVFLAAIKAGLYALAVIGVLASVVGAYYYLRSSRSCISTSRRRPFEPMPGELKVVLGVTGLFNLLFFVYPGAAGRRRRQRRRSRCSDAARSHGGGGRRAAHRRTRCSARPMPRRWRCARAGERGPLWITAARQTAGRGRRGRAWMSEPGNLYASLLLTDPAPPAHLPELCFVAALAMHDAVAELRRRGWRRGSTLKWPNDLLLDGAKFAGILIEGGEAALRRSPSASASIARTIRTDTDLSGDRSCGAPAPRSAPETLFARAVAPRCWRGSRNGTAARALPPSAPTGSRAPPASASDIRVRLADRELAGTLRELDDTGRLGAAPARRASSRRSRPATCCRAAAGDAVGAG